MEPTIHGLQEIQALISSPVQWQVLLQLSEHPVTTRDLRQRLTSGCLPWALLRLWQHQLIWRRADEQWTLTATGATLRPILQAIQMCTDQKGGTNS